MTPTSHMGPRLQAKRLPMKRAATLVNRGNLRQGMPVSDFLRIGMIWILLVACASIWIFPPGSIASAQGVSSAWTTPVALSTSTPSSWFPSIAADPSGRLHVAWASTLPAPTPPGPGTPSSPQNPKGYDVVMYTTSEHGETWTSPVDIMAFGQATGSEATRPSLLADASGILHMSFRDFDVLYSRARADSAGDSATWLTPVKISTNGAGYYSQLAMDSQGDLHIVYTQNVPSTNCPACFHLLSRTSNDGGVDWSSLTDVSLLPTGAAKPQFLIDRRGGLHVVWESGKGGGLGRLDSPTTIYHSISTDGGTTWSLPYEFPSPGGQGRNVAIGMDGLGKLIVTWLDIPSDRFYFSESDDDGSTWTAPAQIPGPIGYETILDDGTMATDSAGNIHFVTVAYTDQARQHLGLFHLIWEAKTDQWQPTPETVAVYNKNVPEWPRMAISDGNILNLVWFVRDAAHIFDTDHAQYQVFYSKSVVDAPPVSPVHPPFNSLATATATAFPTVAVATPTSPPNLSSTNPTLNLQPVKNENGVLLVVGKSIALSLLLFLAILAFVAMRR